MKSREFRTPEKAAELEVALRKAAATAVSDLAELANTDDPLSVLEKMKFEPVGCDPLDPSRPLNLIEQLNQTFTYLVSVRAVEFLFDEHPEASPFRVNLGTAAGSDVESADGTVAAEVFAAVTPDNNRKLAKDIEKVRSTQASYQYVFFYSPGEFQRQVRDGVVVVPVSLDRAQPPDSTHKPI